jgi:lactate dehydrogenase-like 2-hydroxyacid dehydrogenase
LLTKSDFLVLACDLNESTKNIINKKTLSKMKKDSFLINVARGDVCNEEDLFNCLKDKVISGAAIDTWWIYPDRPKPGFKAKKETSSFGFSFSYIKKCYNDSSQFRTYDGIRYKAVKFDFEKFKRF